MHDPVTTQLYLSAPPLDALDEAVLSAALNTSVACLLADISGFVEAQSGALEAMMRCAHDAECPLLVGGDDALSLDLAKRFALDGVHLSGGAKQVGWVRKQLGTDAIIGYGAGTSRHDAMTAAEGGADYVALGPIADLDPELLTWWQAVIETPLVVEFTFAGDAAEFGAEAAKVAFGAADFVLLAGNFWSGDPLATLAEFNARVSA